MKKSRYSKVLAFLFVVSLVLPLTVSFQSCGNAKYNKLKYNKSRNGGKRVGASGDMGRDRYKKRYRTKGKR
jgi:hypothetical protein